MTSSTVRAPVAGGLPGIFRVDATNTGGTPSAAVGLEITVPVQIRNYQVTVDGEPCVITACEIPELDVDQSVPIVITVGVPATGTPAGSELVARVGSSTSSIDLVVPAAAARLDIGQIQTVVEPVAGESGTYSVTIDNEGGTASGGEPVSVRPPLLDGFRVTAFYFLAGETVVPCGSGDQGCVLRQIEPGQADVLYITAAVASTGANGAAHFDIAGQQRPLPVNVDAADAALTITEFIEIEAPNAGGTGQYLLTVRNDGGEASTEQGLRVLLPTGAAVASCSPGGGEQTCSVPPIQPGDSTEVLIRIGVQITGATGSITVIIGDAPASDPIPIGVDGTPADLTLSEITETEAPTAGGSGSYELVVSNGGGIESDPATLTVSPPDGTSVNVVVIGDVSCVPSEESCTVPELAAVTGTARIQVILAAGTTDVDGILDISLPGEQPQTIRVVVAGSPTALQFTPLTVTEPLVAGGTGELSVTVTNTGRTPSGALPVRVTTVPAGATVSSIAVDGVTCGATCVTPSLGFNASSTIEIRLSIGIGGVSNDTLVVAIGQVDVKTLITVKGTDARLVLGGIEPVAAPVAGGTGRFALTARNTGGQQSDPETLVVTAPTGVSVQAITVNGTACADVTACDVPALRNNQTAAIEFTLGIPNTGISAPNARLTVTAGGDSTFLGLAVAPLPAALDVPQDLDIVTAPTAGGAGRYQLTVINRGGTPSDPQQVTVAVPDGVTDVSTTVGGDGCEGPCGLDGLDPGERTTITVDVSIADRGANGAIVVNVGDRPSTAAIAAAGLPADLTLGPMDITQQPVAGGQGVMTVTVRNAGWQDSLREEIEVGLPDNASVLSVVAGGEACVPTGQAQCTLPPVAGQQTAQIVVTFGVGPAGASGPVSVDVDGVPAENSIKVAALPAQLEVSGLTQTEPPTAGGTGSYALTVINTGGTRSDKQLITVKPPDGAFVAAIQVGDTTCGLEGQTCSLDELPGPSEPVTLSVTLNIGAAGVGGDLVVSVGDEKRPFRVDAPGIASTLEATGKEPLRAGSSSTWTLTPSPPTPDPWPITLPLQADGIAISGYPVDTCGPVEAAVPSIACKGPTIAALTFTVLPTRPAGPAQLAGTADDGRVVEIIGEDGGPLPVAALPAGAPVELTGQYDGTIVGAETMRCRASFLVRWSCARPLTPGMASVGATSREIARPEGSTVVHAALTWAATAPSSPGSLDSLSTSLSPQPIAGVAPAGAPDAPGQLVVRTADVTALLGDARSIAVQPLAASTSVGGSGTDPNVAPMAAWTLTVIWSDPAAPNATVTARVGGQQSVSGSVVDLDATADAGAPVSVDAAFFGTDPWGQKVLSTSTGRPLATGLWGAPGNVTTGFDLVSADATDGPLGSPGDAVQLSNQPGKLIFDVQLPVALPGDSLWLGPSLVTRVEQGPAA